VHAFQQHYKRSLRSQYHTSVKWGGTVLTLARIFGTLARSERNSFSAIPRVRKRVERAMVQNGRACSVFFTKKLSELDQKKLVSAQFRVCSPKQPQLSAQDQNLLLFRDARCFLQVHHLRDSAMCFSTVFLNPCSSTARRRRA
jgi:hypothetical protein